MGREIRRVPKDWVHPTDKDGNDLPMFDKTYEEAAEEWIHEFLQWQAGVHEGQVRYNTSCKYYWEYVGDPPDKDYYRPAFTSEPTCYQVYQTISEGSPTSPVFKTEEDLIEWLVEEGYSREAATKFVKYKYAPSMVVIDGRAKMDIHSLEELD